MANHALAKSFFPFQVHSNFVKSHTNRISTVKAVLKHELERKNVFTEKTIFHLGLLFHNLLVSDGTIV